MGKSNYPGEFEQVVMLALARVGDDAYSVPVHEEILQTTGRDVAIASVYVTLSRLENKGLVSSTPESRAEATGRPRRFYALTDAGWSALERARQMIDSMWEGVSAPGGRR
ncbi:MAG: PadR family transcriptional regulator [Acidobacteria bacterium]|nr:PadR family transcriptional regulator [Acidobacteriota bacterium]